MNYLLELQARENPSSVTKSPSWFSNWACYSTASVWAC